MKRASALLLPWGLLVGLAGSLTGAGPNRVSVAFSQSTFPEVALQDARVAMDIWGEEITRNLKGIDVVSTSIFGSSEALVEAMRSGSVDLAVLTTVDYFKLEPHLNADLALVSKAGTGAAQRYFLIVQAGLPIQQVKGLKNLRLCLVKHESVGALFMNHTLVQLGLPEMDDFFGSVESKSKGSQALSTVYFGGAEACLVSEEAYRTSIAMNPQIERKVRILLTSPQLQGTVAVYRKGYPAHMRRRIEEAVAELKNYPRGAQFLNMFQATEMRQATEADLADTRRLYQEYRRKKGRLP